MPSLGPIVISWIRTIIPTIVAMIVSALFSLGVNLGSGETDALAVVIFGAIASAYYIVVRLLEENVHPMFGALLGVANRPTYNGPDVVVTPVSS